MGNGTQNYRFIGYSEEISVYHFSQEERRLVP